MFNLLVRAGGWADNRDTMLASRVLSYTDPTLIERYKTEGTPDFPALFSFPTLFVQEGRGDEVARIGKITRARSSQRHLYLDYYHDSSIPAITNGQLVKFASGLDIADFEFDHTHWAVKDRDLFQELLVNMQPRRPRPRVFQIADPENIEPSLISVMTPFHPDFDKVYAAISNTAQQSGLNCRRADDIWENPAIIQNVVSLIDRSRIVIGDCSGRNPNVFYEIGIAHTLGRKVILITQSENDIPLDLRHLRYAKYLNNGEGCASLSEKLRQRFGSLL